MTNIINRKYLFTTLCAFMLCFLYGMYLFTEKSITSSTNITTNVIRAYANPKMAFKRALDMDIAYCKIDYQCKNKTKPELKFQHSPENRSFEETYSFHSDVAFGGTWEPYDCHTSQRIAVIIPYKDRLLHLQIFLRNIIPFLKAQKRSFTLFVVEQVGPQIYNKARIMNAGYIEAKKLGDYNCIIFHDADMIPVHMCNMYDCPENGMRHLGLSRNLQKPQYVFTQAMGGASAYSKDIFKQINGFTNHMYGWGGEDDDAYFRLRAEKIKIYQESAFVGNYYHVPHQFCGKHNPHGRRREEARRHFKFRKYDGITSVEYTLHNVTKELLFTRIIISIPGPTKSKGIEKHLFDKIAEFEKLAAKDNSSLENVHR